MISFFSFKCSKSVFHHSFCFSSSRSCHFIAIGRFFLIDCSNKKKQRESNYVKDVVLWLRNFPLLNQVNQYSIMYACSFRKYKLFKKLNMVITSERRGEIIKKMTKLRYYSIPFVLDIDIAHKILHYV